DERASAAYHIPGGVRLSGVLQCGALQRALDTSVARHEVLRTGFVRQDDGSTVQLIAAEDIGLPLLLKDLSGCADREAELRNHAEAEASTPFDLTRAPLIRGRLLKLDEEEHALLVTMHHIASDGWSMGVLINELSALYTAFVQGEPDPLPALQIQYVDYAAWQRQRITGELLHRQLSFWREHLQGAPALLELPTDHPRSGVQDYSGTSVAIEIDEVTSQGLRALAARHGATLHMVLLAAWGALLSRLSGQSDVVVGTPIANRGRAEIEPVIGFFVNTLALRIELSGNPSVGELLAQVKATTLAAQAHQDVPFEQVIEALNPVRSMAHQPLFQVMFAWQNAPEGTLELPGLKLQSLSGSDLTAKFDLTLALGESGGVIGGTLSYATALFERASVERFVAHLYTLLQGFVAGDTVRDSARVAQLPLLAQAERRQLLVEWNDTAREFPADGCIHALFEDQVERTPDAVALVFEDESLSYAELDARANRLAHHLQSLGVGPDARVALLLERGVSMVVALLATLKAGGAYVPLDPAYPTERLAFMLQDCAPLVVLSDAACLRALALPADLPVCRLDDPAAPWLALPGTAPAVPGLRGEHLAYVIYTSGSTGQPKGVMVAHAGIVMRLTGMQQTIPLTPQDRFLQRTSISFDVAVQEILWTLTSGATLVLPHAGRHFDTGHLVALMASARVTVANFVPALLEQLLHSPALAECHSLRVILCGGEALSAAILRRCLALLPARFFNIYGPTETVINALLWEGRADFPGSPPLGTPLPNTCAYVLDAHGQPVPIGVAGELFISGAGVARGYLNRPDLTAERFVPDPFGAPGSRMYRSGDLARWRADGTLEYLGRNDHQVKVRGFRIELGEIEAALQGCPGVREAVVLARGEGADKQLVAYVTGEDVQAVVLREHLATRLPEYMVPAAYVQLEALPLTPNGKLDRRALPAPGDAAYGTRAFEPPQGEIEEELAHIWQDLLGLERVGRADNFFTLGGHSLLAVQLVSRIRLRLGSEVA
ncbi:amino acid adenylation domain-containing protein, partial [Variovorax boronicumulans]|uniref:amino acid adenylation domain-containing protein n=1 Tax=Variovorax boronicumulans TaxID=436515 RepID=UPI003395386F